MVFPESTFEGEIGLCSHFFEYPVFRNFSVQNVVRLKTGSFDEFRIVVASRKFV